MYYRKSSSGSSLAQPASKAISSNDVKGFIGLDEANSEDHSQIVRFVSGLIADGFEGIARTSAFMGVGLHGHGGVRRSKCSFCPAGSAYLMGEYHKL